MSDAERHRRAETQAMVAVAVLGILTVVLFALVAFAGAPMASRVIERWQAERARKTATAGPAKGETLPAGATPAQLRVDLAELFSPDSYPAAAQAAGEQGRVGITLRIGRSGRVRKCTINASSGSRALDTASCQIMRRHGRYEPARDASGRAIASTTRLGVRWQLRE